MATYIALLRGINVGGKNMIKMAELKRMFESLGLYHVQTYIQSGNVLFQSGEEEDSLHAHLEEEVEKAFGISVPVVLRTTAELNAVIRNRPFTGDEIRAAEALGQGESFYVAFLNSPPSPETVASVDVYKNEAEKYHIAGRDVYLLFHGSIRDSKLAANLYRLGAPCTTRNWRTVHKLSDLANAMEV